MTAVSSAGRSKTQFERRRPLGHRNQNPRTASTQPEAAGLGFRGFCPSTDVLFAHLPFRRERGSSFCRLTVKVKLFQQVPSHTPLHLMSHPEGSKLMVPWLGGPPKPELLKIVYPNACARARSAGEINLPCPCAPG